MQFTYGIATSTEVAYYTYIYAKVPKSDYQQVTSFTRVPFYLEDLFPASHLSFLYLDIKLDCPH